jgi:hypothetical protein
MKRTAILSAVAAALLMTVSGCDEPDASQLVGVWQLESGPAYRPDCVITWDFQADGGFKLTAIDAKGGSKSFTGKYHLGFFGDLTMDELSESIGGATMIQTNFTIQGDEMTRRDPDGSVSQLRRVSAAHPAAAKGR